MSTAVTVQAFFKNGEMVGYIQQETNGDYRGGEYWNVYSAYDVNGIEDRLIYCGAAIEGARRMILDWLGFSKSMPIG